VADPVLRAAVLGVLRGGGLATRLRRSLGGGYTALQVFERLGRAGPADVPDARAAVQEVADVLRALADEGLVVRKAQRMTVRMGSKGPRDVVVDVFRAR
jgi:hypothetical protein